MGKKSNEENMQPAIDAPVLAEGMDDQEQGKRAARGKPARALNTISAEQAEQIGGP